MEPVSECSRNEINLLGATLGVAPTDGSIVEVGTATAGTLIHLIKKSKQTRRNDNFIVIDTMNYIPNQLQVVMDSLVKYTDNIKSIKIWPGTSSDFLKICKYSTDLRISLLFIDADHKARPLFKDMALLNYVLPGGYICIHDYQNKFNGVVWIVQRLLRHNKQHLTFVELSDSLIVIKKIGSNKISGLSKIDWAITYLMQPILRLQRSYFKRMK